MKQTTLTENTKVRVPIKKITIPKNIAIYLNDLFIKIGERLANNIQPDPLHQQPKQALISSFILFHTDEFIVYNTIADLKPRI